VGIAFALVLAFVGRRLPVRAPESNAPQARDEKELPV
jgi:hypothetical protein